MQHALIFFNMPANLFIDMNMYNTSIRIRFRDTIWDKPYSSLKKIGVNVFKYNIF